MTKFKAVAGFAVLAIMLVVAAGSAMASVSDITYFTEESSPTNYMGADGVPTGHSVEVLVEMFKRTGSDLTAKDVQIVPWARGYNEVQNTPNTCLFSMARIEARIPLFKWVGPVLTYDFDAIAPKSSGIKIDSIEDLKKLEVGAVRDDLGEALAKEAGIESIDSIANNELNVKKLNEGRIDVWVYAKNSAMLVVKDMGLNPDDYESVWNLSRSELYYAFHKDVDDAVIEALQKALDEMKADGTWETIYNKYY